MDTEDVWGLLSGISVGTMDAWIIIICAIISAFCTGAIKVYRIFEKYKEVRERNDRQEQTIKKHEDLLAKFDEALKQIQKSLDEQRDVNLKQIRYILVQNCEECIENKKISVNKLKSLEEMYEEYIEVFHGNGYVKILMEKTRDLPIIKEFEEE